MNRYFSIPLVFLVGLFVYRAPALTGSGILDPDFYWHLHYGDWILDHGRLPVVDEWSWTMSGQPYTLTQWLGEVALSLAHRTFGSLGTSALAALLVSVTMACSYRAARLYLDNRLAALTVAVASNAILVSLSCRPHQFTHLGLACLTWISSAYLTTGVKARLFWIPPLFALWVNLHGGYVIGLFYLFLLTGVTVADKFVKNECSQIVAASLPLASTTLFAIAATLLNPYGLGAWQYVVEIASLKSASAGIVDEWAATAIKTEVGFNHFAITSAMFACMMTSSKRPPLGALLSAFALAAIGWSAVRLSLMATVLMVPIFAQYLQHTPFFTIAFDGPARRYDRTIHPMVAATILGAALSFSLFLSPATRQAKAHQLKTFPVEEMAFINKQNIKGRILNSHETGGYLIREHRRLVSLDTRLDLYGDDALFSFMLASKGDHLWRDYLQRLDPDVLLINNNAALRQLATEAGLYRTVFIGSRYSVMLRANTRLDLRSVGPIQPTPLQTPAF